MRATPSTPSSDRVKISPVIWEDEGIQLHGMLFLPRIPFSQVAILCNATWEEGECSRRALTGLALQLADTGVAALRFDYAGTGESAGEDFEASLETYRGNIRSAIQWVNGAFSGAAICLVGVRVGANLLATMELPPHDLVLIAPIAEVRRFWRDQRLATIVVCPGAPLGLIADDSHCPTVRYLLRYGHRLHHRVTEEVRHLTLPESLLQGISHTLVVSTQAEKESRQFRKLVSRWQYDNARLKHIACDAPPFWMSHDRDRIELYRYQGLYQTICEWQVRVGPRARPAAHVPPPFQLTSAALPALPRHEIETRFVYTEAERICLAIHKPRNATPVADVAVLLLPATPQDRSGPQRLYLRMANALSESGLWTCRVDHVGCGDSSGTGEFMEQQALGHHVEACMEELRTRGFTRFILIGLCGGASMGVRVALRRRDVVGVAMLNAYRGEGGAAWQVMKSALRRGVHMMRRGVNPLAILRLFSIASIIHRVGLPTRPEQPQEDLPAKEKTKILPEYVVLSRLHCSLLVVYGEASRYRDAFQEQLRHGSLAFLQQRSNTGFCVVPGGTDVFHLPESRALLFRELVDWCLRLVEPLASRLQAAATATDCDGLP